MNAKPHPTPHRPEILAPAGDHDSLVAALQSGADAVYFGLQEGFNARARAGNFSLASLADTVAEVHRAGARVFLAVNTLVFEPELAAVEEVVRAAAAAGVDALIVQDPAVALLARRIAPHLAIHASTQMTISSPEAAVFARDLGVTRVVLPRELSLAEIGRFVQDAALEVEVFVHGALCVAWSGQCLTSAAWGGRSANRGQCAQSCRMPYDLVLDGTLHDLGDVRYLLSPKDLAGLAAVPDLAGLGVHGLKIEGRQKGAHYVATAVRGYRHRVDAVGRGESASPAATTEMEADLLAMSLAYTRGFSPGFLAGSDHQTLVEGRFPKHRGVYLGRVVGVDGNDVVVRPDRNGRPWTGARVRGDAAAGPRGETSVLLPQPEHGDGVAALELRPGMGVGFDAGDPEDKREPGGPVFRVEKRGRDLVLGFGRPGPDLRRVAPGQRVWVTGDPAAGRDTERLLRAPLRSAKQALHVAVEGRAGAPLRITARTAAHEVAVGTRASAQRARSGGLTADILRDKLGSLGDTPFELAALDTTRLDADLHVPVSDLKAARRALVAALESQTAGAAPAPEAPPLPVRPHFASRRPAAPPAEPRLVPLCRHPAQLDAAIALGLPEVELDWMEMVGLSRAVEQARSAGMRVTLATLRVQKPGEESWDGRLARLQPDGVLVRHWGGMVHFARQRDAAPDTLAQVRIHGDFSLNVTNSMTAHHLFDWGLDTLTASHDLDEKQLFAMLDRAPAERFTIVVQHRIATFHTEHCVYAHLLSNGRDYRSCGRPCDSHQIGLRDHLEQVHPVIVDAGCRNTVFNSVAQSSARLVPRLLQRGVRRFRVEFVRETEAEAAAILAAYRDLVAGRIGPDAVLRDLAVTAQHGVSASPMQLLVSQPGAST